MPQSPPRAAFTDIAAAIKRYSLVRMLGWQDIRQRYRRSALGPFWLTISMGVMIGTIGLVFGTIFQTSMNEFLPFLTIGIIIWSLIASVVTEGCSGFIAAEGIIKQLPIPIFVHVLRVVWRNIIIFFHNFLIFTVVVISLLIVPSLIYFISIIGFVILIVNLIWVALVMAVICTRFRDITQIVVSVMQVLFYLTPIMWMPKQLPEQSAGYLLGLNPVFHLIEIVRAPLLGEMPTALNWEVSIASALLGWCLALIVYGRYKRRIAYWL